MGISAIFAVMIYGVVRGVCRDEWWFMVGVGLFFPMAVVLGLIVACVVR